jgi:hypothetical protein
VDSTAEETARKFLAMSGLSMKLARDVFYQWTNTAGLDEGIELGIKS